MSDDLATSESAIAIDAMGGDAAPGPIVDGAVAAARHLASGLRLAGPSTVLAAELARHPDASALRMTVVEAPDVIGMDEPPAAALRRKPGASIRVAMGEVAAGRASAVFSAGSTGATVMAACTELGLLPGVDRPALAATIPTRGRPAVLLDAGANAECRPAHLVQFAVMGAVFAQAALDVARPRVALLSIGEEASKGNELTREAHRQLRAAPVGFIGNIEARDVYAGAADVIVCDGFTGNVALKVSEGLVEMVETLLGAELSATFTTRVGYLLSLRAFRRFRRRVDYTEYGGALLVGVRGVVVVGHGRSSAKAVRNAIALAARYSRERLVDRLAAGIAGIPVTTS
ncbi:MAG TPA: phosphate acyltransferase PlsX [Vicinamibacterales bacterium]